MKRRYISVAIGLVIVIAVAVFGNLLKIGKVEVAFEKAPVSATAEEIYDNSTIILGDSILSLNENVVKRNIMNSYEDNSIAVTDIVRVFPNKIIIYCIEHVPTCLVERKDDNDVYAVADGDFQLNKVVRKKDVDVDDYILIEGVVVEDSYNTPQFKTLNKVFRTIDKEGLILAEQPKIFSKVLYSESKIILYTRSGEIIECDYSTVTIEEAVSSAYKSHFNG